MSESQTELLRDAYIRPIRNVVILDDRFRNYSLLVDELVEAGVAVEERGAREESQPGRRRDTGELQRAAKLWEACRQQGWTCDIESQVPSGDAEGKVLNCDLLVLDYHLVGDDPLPALGLLRTIAAAKRFSLVVLYTIEEDLQGVHTRVAAHLRGCRRPTDFDESVRTLWEDMEVENLDEKVDVHDLFDLLAGGAARHRRSRLIDIVKRHDKEGKHVEQVLDLVLENYLLRRVLSNMRDPPSVDPRTRTRLPEPGQDLRWVQHGNLFVCIVSKKVHQGAAVFEMLNEALKSWAPSPLHMILAYARERISAGGLNLDSSVLEDDALRTAWVYHALSSPDSHGIRELARRLLEGVRDQIILDIAEYSSSLLEARGADAPKAENELKEHRERLERARSVAKADTAKSNELQVFLALNTYLCSDAFRGAHITTGTVVRDDDGQYWICVSPACDLVPGQTRVSRNSDHQTKNAQSSLRDELRPWLPATFLRGTPCEPKAAAEPQQGRWVFINDEGRKILEVLNDKKAPQTRAFLLANEGKVKDGRVQLVHFGKKDSVGDEATASTIELPQPRLINAAPVGQLRPEYASLLLQAAGAHGSRIGVDFLKFPKSDQFPGPKSPPVQKREVEGQKLAERTSVKGDDGVQLPGAEEGGTKAAGERTP